MKQYKSIIVAAAALAVVSCADEKMQAFQTVDPNSEHNAQYAYLNDYADLKSYVDHSAFPNFKLGGAVDGAKFNEQKLEYALAVNNFEEVVTGNTFKYSYCVDAKGNMDFSTVSDFVKNASAAGLSIYGHTLAWHSQQQPQYLNKLLDDKPVPVDPSDDGGNPCLVFNNGEGKANSWDAQGIYTLPQPLEAGKTYTVKAKLKSTEGGPCALWPIWDASPNKDTWGGSTDLLYLTTYTTTTEFTEYEWTFESPWPIDHIKFVFGQLVGNLYLDNFSCKEQGSDVELVENGTFDAPLTGWSVNWNGPQISVETISSGKGINCLTYNNGEGKSNPWDAQAVCTLATPMQQGKSYKVTVNVKSENGGPLGLWPIWAASPNRDQWGNSADVQYLDTYDNISTKFKEYTWEFTANFPHDKLQFVFGKLVGKLYFQNVSCVEVDTENELMANTSFESGSVSGWSNNWNGPSFGIEKVVLASIPLTDQEKKDTLTWAMDQWIKGMMEACDGKVKAWDVVNEPIAGWGAPDTENVLPLQHGDAENPDAVNFFWQDYMGDYDYVRTAVKLARQYGPEDMTLFINDYDLEGATTNQAPYHYLPNQRKVESLIKWIERWESDNETKIDGIGTQMHICYYENEEELAGLKAGIEQSFQKLAASGKMIRISELDMGYVDADFNKVMTADMTEERHHKMEQLYTFVIQKYLEIIPKDQQWGICAWGVTDQPTDSGWRPGEPTGLWDLNYYRKHTYAGFAKGLAGK